MNPQDEQVVILQTLSAYNGSTAAELSGKIKNISRERLHAGLLELKKKNQIKEDQTRMCEVTMQICSTWWLEKSKD